MNAMVSKENEKQSLTTVQTSFLLIFLLFAIIVFISPTFYGHSFFSLFTTLGIIGFVCTITGVFTSIYQARGEVIVYAFMITNTITYAWLSLASDLYGQVFQNLILLLPIQIFGFYSWWLNTKKHKKNRIEIRSFTVKQWIICLTLAPIAWIAYQYFLKYLPLIVSGLFHKHVAADPTPYLDSLVAVCTVIAMSLTAKRFIEQWWFWIFCNIIGVILFIEPMIHTTMSSTMMVNDLSGIFNWLQYGVGSAYGLYLDRKSTRLNSSH